MTLINNFSRFVIVFLLVVLSFLGGVLLNLILFFGGIKLLSPQIGTMIALMAPIPLMWVGIFLLIKSVLRSNKIGSKYSEPYNFSNKFDWLLIRQYMLASFSVGMILFYQQMLAGLPWQITRRHRSWRSRRPPNCTTKLPRCIKSWFYRRRSRANSESVWFPQVLHKLK